MTQKYPSASYLFLVPETRKFHQKRGSYFFCLVPHVPVWYRLSGTPFCSFTSVTLTSQRKAQRFPRRQRVPVTLKRTLLACFSLKCISQRGTRKIIKSQCWIQTDKSQSRVIRCHIPVSATASTGICDMHRITLDWDLSVWIQHWYLILLIYADNQVI